MYPKVFTTFLITILLAFTGCTRTIIRNSSPLPTEGDFHSVFLFSDGKHFATAFAVERNGKEYFVTARHFASFMAIKDTALIFLKNEWVPIHVILVGQGKGTIDISVFALDHALDNSTFPRTPLPSAEDSFEFVGSQAWTIGFPLGFLKNDSDRSFPLPFLKHAYISAVQGNPRQFYLDGIGNRGSSGSPVYGTNKKGELRILGVVADLLTERLNADTSIVNNSGLFRADYIGYAKLLIDANPVGAPLR